nr:Rho-associated protein kinase [Ipomoea batatas]
MELRRRRRRHRNRAPSPAPQQSSVTGAAAELRHRRHRSRAPSPSPLQQSSVAVAVAADRTPPSVTAKSFTWKQFDLEIKQLSGVEGTGMNIKLESLRKENMDLLEKTESLKQELGSVKLKCSMKQSKGVFAIVGTPK